MFACGVEVLLKRSTDQPTVVSIDRWHIYTCGPCKKGFIVLCGISLA